ncbi:MULTISPECIES: hypothetical protein [unclassified Actinotalea]|uniref:hypothetical protein n=1 Tax=unclassified Actinotalea TaxID=2638618 RepID=UPI0015F41355|nr:MULTISPECIES: hypothetical protein [unclassified Actinotalea]
MGGRPSKGAVVEGVVAGTVAALWYALPDVVRSRGRRVVLKTALVAAGGAYGVALARRERQEADGAADEATADTATTPEEAALARIRALTSTVPVLDAGAAGPPPPPDRTRVLLIGAAVLAGTVATVAGTVALERAIYRWGERRRARGVRLPHTQTGLVAGLLLGLSSLAAPASEARSGVTRG